MVERHQLRRIVAGHGRRLHVIRLGKVRQIVVEQEQDVLAPARAAGYRQVWLLGVSLGAFGALAHAAEHPDAVDGVQDADTVLVGPTR